MFSKKATKVDEIFTVDLTLCRKCQIDGKDFVNFCGLHGIGAIFTLRKDIGVGGWSRKWQFSLTSCSNMFNLT